METTALPFRDLAYVIIAAITGGLIAWRLRQPLIIGYVLAGVIISPLTPGPSVSDIHSLELFAEIGVVLLMFAIGMEFSVRELLQTKWVALVGGPLGIVISIILGSGAGYLLGWKPLQGIVLGAVISVASTMVMTRLLIDQGLLRTTAGRVMVTITLVEDFAVVVLVVLIPGFANLSTGQNLLRDLGLAALILAPTLFLAWKIVPPLLTRVARTQSRELFFLVVLAICLGTAALTSAIGLSLALGAFAAGLIISESGYAHESIGQLFPLRDAFVAVFFVSIGLLINPTILFANLSVLGLMLLLIVLGKFVVWTGVVRLFGYPLATAVIAGVGLTQIGEFSFILVQAARNAGIVGPEMYNATLAASLITILLNAALIRHIPAAMARWRLEKQARALPVLSRETEAEGLRDHVVLCGFGRLGSGIGSAFETFGVRYSVIEVDPDVVATLRTRDILSIFGDCSHTNVLESAGIHNASLLIVTVPDRDRAWLAITNARRISATVPIIARAHRREDYEFLISAGATEVIQPETEASATMIRHACGHYLMVPDWQIRTYLKSFRDAMDSAQRMPATTPALSVPEVRKITVTNSQFAGRSLRDIKLREAYGVTVVAIRRISGESLINPSADTVLEVNDRLRVLGRSDEIDTFEAQVAATDPALSETQGS